MLSTAVPVMPSPVVAASRWAAGLSSMREPRALLPSAAKVSALAGSYPSRSASPPGQTALMIRRMVAVLGAIWMAKAVAVRAPSRARAS